jgi:hypothetical protein
MSAELSQFRAKDRSLEDSTVNVCGLRSYLPASSEATYPKVRSYILQGLPLPGSGATPPWFRSYPSLVQELLFPGSEATPP